MDASLLRLEALYSTQNSVIESCWTFKLGYFGHAQTSITVEQCKMFDHKPQTNSVVQCDSRSHTSPAVLYTQNKCPLKRRCHQISLCHVLPAFHSDIVLADEITNATTSSHGSLIIRLCTQWTSLKMCCHQSAVATEDHQYLPHLANNPGASVTCPFRELLPGTTGHCHVSPEVVCTWWISTQMPLQSDICCYQFYAHKWMSTEMALQSEIICCCFISFMHTSECPPRWHCNQKSSGAISSVLCTQASLHWDGVAITNDLLLSRQFYAILSVSHHLYAHR